MEDLNLRAALESNGATLDENQLKFVGGLEVALRAAMAKEDGKISETITKHLSENGGDESVNAQLRSLATKMETIEKASLVSLNAKQKRSLRKEVETHKDAIIDAIRSGKSLGKEDEGIFQIRAAAPHFDTNTVSLGAGVVAPIVENTETSPVVAFTRYPENFILNVIRNMQVAKVRHTMFNLEETTKEGDAAIVTEAAEKPLVQYKFVKNAIGRTKYAGRIEWSEEFEMDNEMLFAAIVKMIENDVIRKWNNDIIAKIIANSVPYTVSPYSDTVIAPDATDVALVLQGLVNTQNMDANTVILNPATIVALMLIKKADGERIGNPMFVDGKINGMTVIASNQMAVGQILVFDSGIYYEMHSDLIVRVGRYNDQLITNENTLIVEMHSMLTFAKMDLVGSRYGAIATIAADLLKP